jgi:cob(I)alamin adenosyltransferase
MPNGDLGKRGFVYLYTGDGGGKTTAALGIVLRSVAHKHRAVVIQFMKAWKKTGEWLIRGRLKPFYEIKQFGRLGWVDLKKPSARDRAFARKGLEYAEKVFMKGKADLVVLDEVNIACAYGLLDVKEVLRTLDKKPEKTDVVLTGRSAPKELVERADFVNEVKPLKNPYSREGMFATEGVQY